MKKKTKKKIPVKKKKENAKLTKPSKSKAVVPTKSTTERLPVKYGFPYIPAADEALKHYIRKIKHYPILTAEEERKLIESYRKYKNLDAVRELIQSNLRLVVKIALEYSHAIQNLLDMIQEGNIGLMKAVQKYDPEKGARLGYYASWWIRSYILKYIMDNFRLVKVGTTQAQKKLFFNLIREKRRIEAMGFEAQDTRKLLADKFDVSEKQIDEMSTRLSKSEVSLDVKTSGGDNGGLYLIDMIDDKSQSPLEDLLTSERRELLVGKLKEFSKTLSKKEKIILQKRLLAEIPKTLEELGNEFGVTKERVRQLQNRLLSKFKEELSDFAEDFYESEE